MLELHAIAGSEGHKRAHLIFYIVLNFRRLQNHLASAESHKIRITRMGTHSHLSLRGFFDHLIHDHGIPSMPAAGNISRCDILYDFVIISNGICPKALPHITV